LHGAWSKGHSVKHDISKYEARNPGEASRRDQYETTSNDQISKCSKAKKFRKFGFSTFEFARPVKYVRKHLSLIDHDASKGGTPILSKLFNRVKISIFGFRVSYEG